MRLLSYRRLSMCYAMIKVAPGENRGASRREGWLLQTQMDGGGSKVVLVLQEEWRSVGQSERAFSM